MEFIGVVLWGFLAGVQDIVIAPRSLYRYDSRMAFLKKRTRVQKPQRNRITRTPHRIAAVIDDEDTDSSSISRDEEGKNRSSITDNRRSDESTSYQEKPGIRKPLLCMWKVNIFILFATFVLKTLASYCLVPVLSVLLHERYLELIVSTGGALFYFFWQIPFMVIMEVLNMVYIKDILDKIYSVDRKLSKSSRKPNTPDTTASSTKTAAKSLGLSTMDRIYASIFLFVFLIQSHLINIFLTSFLQIISFGIHMSLLYSFYAFEYRWCYEGHHFMYRLNRVERYWPYLLGFGFPFGLVLSLLPPLLSLVCVNLTYPLLVVGAQSVHWSHVRALFYPTATEGSHAPPTADTEQSQLAHAIFLPSLLVTKKIIMLLNWIIGWMQSHFFT